MGTVRTHRRAIAGFTLMEMMVVLVIIAIIAAYGIPSYKTATTQSRMSGELAELDSDISLARSSAIREGINVTICPSGDPTNANPTCTGSNEWNGGWIVFTDVAGNQTFETTAGDTLLHIHNVFSSNDTLLSAVAGGTTALNAFTFNRMGGVSNSMGSGADGPNSGELLLNNANGVPGMTRCLIISNAGTITVNSPQTTTQSNC